MIFFGATSSRSSGDSCCRRQRLRRAMATARLALSCPTIYLSSSCTISRGVSASIPRPDWLRLEFFEVNVTVGVDTNICRDTHRRLDDFTSAQRRVLLQSTCCSQRIRTTRANTNDAIIWFNDIACARENQRSVPICYGEQGFQAPQHPVSSPVLGELDSGTHQTATVLF